MNKSNMCNTKNMCQKVFLCACYPDGSVLNCTYKKSSYANNICDDQAAVGEHIAFCNNMEANKNTEENNKT
jgi:hypothetical protein